MLGRVIDSLNNTFIGVGDLDFLLPTNGTLLALQNVTWGGKRGFEARPDRRELFVPYHDDEGNEGAPSAAGEVGRWGVERGLVFYNVWLAGHGELHPPLSFQLYHVYRVWCEPGDGIQHANITFFSQQNSQHTVPAPPIESWKPCSDVSVT